MGRNPSKSVPSYPHSVKNGRKMHVVEQKYGNDGYATWHKLLELLGSSDDHYLNLSNDVTRMYTAAYCKVPEETMIGVIEIIVSSGKFDKEFWQSQILYCQDLVDSIKFHYKKRVNKIVTRNEVAEIISKNSKTNEKLKSNTKQSKEPDMAKKIDKSPECIQRFESWWNSYDKKVGRDKSMDKFQRLTIDEQHKCIEHTPLYVESTPDKTYRKNPLTYLNGKHFYDEIILNGQIVKQTAVNSADNTNWDEK